MQSGYKTSVAAVVALPLASLSTSPHGIVEPVDNGQPKHLLIGWTLSQLSPKGEVLFQVLNVSPEPVKIYQGTKLGQGTPYAQYWCQQHNPPQQQAQASLGTILANYPFEKMSWDIMRPLPLTDITGTFSWS